jgi:hypothetical protein
MLLNLEAYELRGYCDSKKLKQFAPCVEILQFSGLNLQGSGNSSGASGSMDQVKHENFCRAVVEDNTALLLTAVEGFRKEALGRIRKGSAASKALDQEMSARLLHLACKHDAVKCARLLLEGGDAGVAPAAVDARDQLTRTPLHVAAETHSAKCIELLLSKNARTDLRVVEGQPLLPLEIALMSKRYVPVHCNT